MNTKREENKNDTSATRANVINHDTTEVNTSLQEEAEEIRKIQDRLEELAIIASSDFEEEN